VLQLVIIVNNADKSWVEWGVNYKDDSFIERMIANSNVVINLLGPRNKNKKREDFEFINIEVAEKIAKACTKYGVHRLIQFSAAAAQADSESLDFQTKFEAESIVQEAFPAATIFRPCTIYGMNDRFADVIRRQNYFTWNHFVPVYDDCTTKKQPIKAIDVAQCVINALKLEESKVLFIDLCRVKLIN
jgi:NADH dehydrogenase (ubiquinone) 1 alpha subcomplex subunit 9